METVNLTSHFLIAMPGMTDPNFARTLTFICEHSSQGALGLVVNRPIELNLQGLFDQIGIELRNPEAGAMPVYFGGPVLTERGFVLHQPVGNWQSTLSVGGGFGLTTSKDILEAVGRNEGPDKMLVSLGYAGWAPGQLEQEMAANSWLSVQAKPEVIFDLAPEERLAAAMQMLGVDYATLSDFAGHA
jgi:putative transcriptional regulator